MIMNKKIKIQSPLCCILCILVLLLQLRQRVIVNSVKVVHRKHRSRYKLTPFLIKLAWATENVDAINAYMLAEIAALEAKVESRKRK